MPVAKEQIRQSISNNNISSVADVYMLLRDGFRDILQELMEAELDAALGYEKNQKGNIETTNKRNGHSPKKLKSQYGEFQIDVPRDRNGEFEPKLIPKYQRDISGIEEKVISLYARGMSTRDIHDQLQDLRKKICEACPFIGYDYAIIPKIFFVCLISDQNFRFSLKGRNTISIYLSAKRPRIGTIVKNHIQSSSCLFRTALFVCSESDTSLMN